MILPNAVIAGVNKAGTTSLFHALAENPHVLASTVKETHFFDPVRYGGDRPDLETYAALFPQHAGESVILEATPGYFYGGARLAECMDRTLPGVRIIMVLREPGARAFSWWRFSRSRLLVDPSLSFSAYLEQCRQMGRTPEESPELVGWRALSGGAYSEYLPAWQKVFGDRLLVLFYDDLADPPEMLSRICAHLEIPSAGDPGDRHENRTTDIANRRLQAVALSLNRMGEPLWRSAPRIKSVLRASYYALNARRSQERLSAEDRDWLTEYFTDEVAALATLFEPSTGLPAWLSGGRG